MFANIVSAAMGICYFVTDTSTTAPPREKTDERGRISLEP